MDKIDDSFDDVLATFDIHESVDEPVETSDQPSTTSNSEILPKSSFTSEAGKSTSTSTATIEKPKYSNSIKVHPNQRGNPILKSITNIPWEFDSTIVPDYIVGRTACVLFLSIRYHNLKPDYINERIKLLGKSYELRVLLVQVDIKESQNALKHLTRLCLLADLTLMVAWTPEECGKIIETYKMLENKPAEYLMDKTENDNYQKVVNALTSIKSVNTTDAMTLLSNFGTLENLIKASEGKLNACPGLGTKKAQKLLKVFNEQFMK